MYAQWYVNLNRINIESDAFAHTNKTKNINGCHQSTTHQTKWSRLYKTEHLGQSVKEFK